MNYGVEKVSAAESRSEELQLLFHELSKVSGFVANCKAEVTVQQFIDLCYLQISLLDKKGKISADMLNSLDPIETPILRRKVNSLGDSGFNLCREIAKAHRYGSLENKRQAVYVLLNATVGRKHKR